jgi:putative SOS response-associated peptidase YedK
MCNHYRDTAAIADHARAIRRLAIPLDLPNLPVEIFPKRLAKVLVQSGGERSVAVKAWGVPVEIKGAKGQRLIKPVTNARNDKLTGYVWRYAVQKRRCLIPATGYYEPGLGPVGAKGEILFTVKERPCFFLAGLWDGDAFTMVTTEPNEFVRQFHDRMPVVLGETEAVAWLGDEPLAAADLAHLCCGLPVEALHHEPLPPRLKVTRLAKDTKPPQADDEPTLF